MKKRDWLLENLQQLKISLKWIVFAAISGTAVGVVGTLFHFCLAGVTQSRAERPGSLTPSHFKINRKASNGLIFLSKSKFHIARYL